MDTFNVFVIGPMGKDKDDPKESGTPISEHMANIAAALRAVVPRYIKPPQRWEVISPLEGMGGQITDWVFGHMDDTDLAIADITSRSPSVMYELSYFHALGIPIIIIDDKNVSINTAPFYLQGAYILRVNSFSVQSLTSELNETLQSFFNEDDFQDFANNPITNFYGSPLVEVSGAATIAAGYYENYISKIINRTGGAMKVYSDGPIDNLYIVRPGDEMDWDSDLEKFRALLGGRGETVFRDAAGERIVGAHYDGQSLFDLPRTAYTLGYSPRLAKLEARIAIIEKTGQPLREERKKQMRVRALEKLIDSFFYQLQDRVRHDRSAMRNRIKIISFSQLEEIRSGRP